MDSIDNVYKLTLNIYENIKRNYLEPKIITENISSFEPLSYDFGIDGLDNPKSFVYPKYMQLNEHLLVKIDDAIINFYYDNHDDVKELIRKCTMRIHCMLHVFGNKFHKNIEFHILLYDATRAITREYFQIPNEINELGEYALFNCVCGYAAMNRNKFTICVSRKNGCLGLLVHELCHTCCLDASTCDDKEYKFPIHKFKQWNNYTKEHMHYNSGQFSEGVNNANSTILHAMFNAIENHTEYHECLKEEINHAFEMSAKLLSWFKYKSYTEFLEHPERYTQKSQMFEYIILRAIYLLYFEELDLINKKLEDEDEYMQNFFKFFESENTHNIIDDSIRKLQKEDFLMKMEYYAN